MNDSIITRLLLVGATALFIIWNLLFTVCWPVEDYANVVHAYTESTNLIARGLTLGLTAYLSFVVIVLAWYITRQKGKRAR